MTEIQSRCVGCAAPLPAGAEGCGDCGLAVRIPAPYSADTGVPTKPSSGAPAGVSRGMRVAILGTAVAVGLVTLFLLYVSRLPHAATDSGAETRADNGRMPAGSADAEAAPGAVPEMSTASADSLRSLSEVVARDPGNSAHLLGLANALFDAGRFVDAHGYYRRYLAQDVRNADVRVDLATCEFQENQLSAAAAQLDSALAVDPQHANALYNLGVVLSAAGKPDQAREAWSRYVRYHPDAPRAAELKQRLQKR